MVRLYSANDELKNLMQSIDYKIFIFDDPRGLGAEIKLRDQDKNGEIDGILLYKNIVCLVGSNKGEGEEVNAEIIKFFEKLDNVNTYDDLNIKLSIATKQGKNIDDKFKVANDMVKVIKDYVNKVSKTHNIILKKIFFCPYRQIDEEKIREERAKDKIIIDKDAFDYFQEVLNRLDKQFLFNDFTYFLNVKKVDLEKKGASRSRKPAQSQPFKNVTRLELKDKEVIAFTLSLSVEDILSNVTVFRMAQKYDKKGFQRMVKSTRLDKINSEYLSKNETFPNNIIFALNPEVYNKESDFYDESEIKFFDEYNSLIIIDGQHRFFSFVKGEKKEREILATFVFFKVGNQADDYLLMEEMFYKINKTQERIDPNLSFILKARIDKTSDEYFWYEVFKKLNKTGFFANRFSFKESTLRKKEAKKSIISVIAYGGVLALNKTYKKKGLEIDGLNIFYGSDRNNSLTFAFNLLKNYFDIIEMVLYKQNFDTDQLNPREIGALIRLLKHFLLTHKDQLQIMGETKNITKSKDQQHKKVIKAIQAMLSYIPFQKAAALTYSASNWAAIEGYMLKRIHRINPRFGNSKLLSKKAMDIYGR